MINQLPGLFCYNPVIQHIMEKLACHSRKQLIEFAADTEVFDVLLNSLFTRSFTLNQNYLGLPV